MKKTNTNNIINYFMSDQNLDKLSNLENQIYDFGSKISNLLENLKIYLNGEGPREINEHSFNLDDLFRMITYIKEEMHKQVEEVYKEGSYQHLTKIHFDVLERINYLKELKR